MNWSLQKTKTIGWMGAVFVDSKLKFAKFDCVWTIFGFLWIQPKSLFISPCYYIRNVDPPFKSKNKKAKRLQPQFSWDVKDTLLVDCLENCRTLNANFYHFGLSEVINLEIYQVSQWRKLFLWTILLQNSKCRLALHFFCFFIFCMTTIF